MRKITLSLLAISFFMLIICSCDINTPSQPNLRFSREAVVKTGDNEYLISVKSESDSYIKIVVKNDDTLGGMSYTYTRDTLYIEYKKLRCNASKDYLLENSFADVIYQTISCCDAEKLRVKNSDSEKTEYTLRCSYGEISLLCDTKTGDIKEIIPSYTDMTIAFE